jgi:hypothetical protein
MYVSFNSLKQISGNIGKPKDDVQILSDKESFGYLQLFKPLIQSISSINFLLGCFFVFTSF